ncbi:unnamed protein product [Adineta ricciae]|uniref:Uncharacterized protein n=1 Tax=Adineta ricciae TaxID=249248 RepID=A0A814I0T1_ADIRI|nr:unnamed protein product [Adineta ricciae]
MIVMPINPNSVYISMAPKGCCKSEFDPTYPAQLNGVIRQDEFQTSIENINRSIDSQKFMVPVLIIFIVCLLGGMGSVIGGVLSVASSRSTSFFALIGVGAGLFFFGMVFFTVVSCIIQVRVTKRMRAAVAAESAKYSTRSTPCSWRIDTTVTVVGYGRNRRARTIYHLVIDIGRQAAPFGGNPAYQGNSYSGAPNMQYAPPPYSAQASAGFCGRCGVPRVNQTMKFCASCGQAYPS